jgi:hypothetical protein
MKTVPRLCMVQCNTELCPRSLSAPSLSECQIQRAASRHELPGDHMSSVEVVGVQHSFLEHVLHKIAAQSSSYLSTPHNRARYMTYHLQCISTNFCSNARFRKCVQKLLTGKEPDRAWMASKQKLVPACVAIHRHQLTKPYNTTTN